MPEAVRKIATAELSFTSRWATLLACAAIVLAATIAYQSSLNSPFILDDEAGIVNNRSIRHLGPISRVLSPTHHESPISGRPMVNLSLALNYALGGTDVRGYHALNLAIHILVGMTIFGVVRRTFLQPVLRARFGAAALPLALAVALIWTVHPLQTRAVTYVSQRGELLMGLFYLLTLYCFVRGIQPNARSAWHFLAVVACLVGMGSKEVMVSAPLMVLLYDRTFVAGSFRAAWNQRSRLYVTLATTWLLLGYLVVVKFKYGGTAEFNTNVTWRSYAETQVWGIARYLRLSVWPHPLVFDYGPLVPWIGAGEMALSSLTLLLTALGTGISLWRWPAIGFLGAGFFMILAPSSVVPILPELIGEHRMYLSLASAIVLLVLAIHVAFARWSRLVFAALIGAAVLLTLQRNEDFRSARAIWSDSVAKRPDNPRAQNNLGTALLDDGEAETALAHFKKALALQPDYALASNNLGVALVRLGRLEEAMAVYGMGLASGRGAAGAAFGLGDALWRAGRRSEASAYYRQAQAIDPGSAEASLNLGNSLLVQGDTDGAIAQWQRAVAIQPALVDAHLNLGIALFQKGQTDESIAHFLLALRVRPDSTETRDNSRRAAWVLSTSPDASARNGTKAVELAQELNRFSGGNAPEDLHTLAAAYAEAGRFAEAVAAAERALQLAAARNDAALQEYIRDHLRLFRANSALRVAGPSAAPVIPD